MNIRLLSKRIALALTLVGCIPSESSDDAGPCPTTCSIDGGPAACTDLSSDTANCGACGHRCDTAYCMFGSCMVQIAPDSVGAVSIAVDNGTLYWSSSHDIMAMPVDGGAMTQIATNQVNPGNVVADDSQVYWTTSTGLMVAPLDGGAASTVAVGVERRPAVDATNVYWVQPSDGGAVLMTALKLGGASTVVAGVSQPTAVAVDDANVYVHTDDVNDAIMKIAKYDAGTTSVLATSTGQIDFISVPGDDVYWPFMRVWKTGGVASSFDWTKESATTDVTSFVTDGKNVFWIGTTQGGVGAGGVGMVTTPASGGAEKVLLDVGGLFGGGPTDLALDSTSLYWAQSGIYRVAKP
jgi:hypothetical protein